MTKINANLVINKTVSAEVRQTAVAAAGSKTLTPITRNYSGIGNETAIVEIDNKASTIEVKLINHNYASRFEFPNTGTEAVLYIDTADNKTYRWSAGELKYYCVGSDYNEIEIINGGKAENGKCDTE